MQNEKVSALRFTSCRDAKAEGRVQNARAAVVGGFDATKKERK